jgi:hypothetical protein
MFMLMFFDSQARISLLGEVDCACMVNNQRRHGVAIAGFRMCCSEAGSICVSSPPNRELLELVGRSGHPYPISGCASWYKRGEERNREIPPILQRVGGCCGGFHTL